MLKRKNVFAGKNMKTKLVMLATVAALFCLSEQDADAAVTDNGNGSYSFSGGDVQSLGHSTSTSASNFFSSFVQDFLATSNFTQIGIQSFLGPWAGSYVSNGLPASWTGTLSLDAATKQLSLVAVSTERYWASANQLGANYNNFAATTGFTAKAQSVAVPGPEAGAGIGALAMAGLAIYMRRRRKDEGLAA